MLSSGIVALLALTSTSMYVAAQTAYPPANPPKGKAIQWVGHSFHFFLPEPVAQLAQEAGIKGHVNLGVDRIGASTPCQHWNKGGEEGTNPVKEMLKSGKADVLTLSTREQIPEPCIAKFTQLGFQNNKKIRVMVHETWLPFSTDSNECGFPKSGGGGKGAAPGGKSSAGSIPFGLIPVCSDRDRATFDTLEKTRKTFEEPYKTKIRSQLTGLNRQLGVNTTTMVPVWDAVMTLREMTVNGKIPNVAKQTDLFQDALGHPKKPLRDMASYMWFAALYGINPMGSKVLSGGDSAQAAVLQKIAWDTLVKEPLNGLQK